MSSMPRSSVVNRDFDAGYKATPVSPQSQEAELQRQFLDAVEGLTAIQVQLQRINRVRSAA